MAQPFLSSVLASTQINPSLVHKLLEDASLELLLGSEDINEEHFDIEDFFNKIDGIKPKHMSWKVRVRLL